MNDNSIKSATTAGLLGIFLGAVGAHCWYLGDKKKGTTHVIIFGAGLAALIVKGAILPSMLSFWTLYNIIWLLSLLSWAGWLAIGASEIWGFIEGIQILSQGDAGLAQKGYRVAPSPMPNFGGNFNNPNNAMNNQNYQNYQNNQGYQNNQNNQNNQGYQNNQNHQNDQSNQNNNLNNQMNQNHSNQNRF